MESFEAYGIQGVNYNRNGEQSLVCPMCSHDRKKKTTKCLNVNIAKGVWICHHCGWNGFLKQNNYIPEPKTYTIPEVIINPLSTKAILWLEKERGLNRETLSHFKLFSATKYFHQKDKYPAGQNTCIGFPYYRGETIINCKYRDGIKRFSLETGAELIAYNENSIRGEMQVVIVEGELDVLSVHQSGYRQVISPPAGANLNRNNLEWLDKIYDLFDSVEKIILALDNDPAGESLKTDLIRRFGSERVWITTWPQDCKDANEVLIKYGESVVKSCLGQSRQLPLEGIIDSDFIADSVLGFYENGLPKGVSLQWQSFSELFKTIRGEFMVVTGIPTHGKSVWSENYMMQLARIHDWKFGVCVFESDPDVMALNLMQILVGKKFFGENRMTEIERDYAIGFVKKHFYFFDVGETSNTFDKILERGQQLVRRHGIDMLYIDPYSYIEKDRGRMTDIEYFEAQLPKNKRFRKHNDCGILLVAHPRKMIKDKATGLYPVPEPYDIGGSNQWFGAPDKIISVYAHYEEDGKISNHSIHIQKQKKWWLGSKGVVDFKMLEHGEFIELQEYSQRNINPVSDYKIRQANDEIMKSKTIEEDERKQEYGGTFKDPLGPIDAPF